MGDGKAIGYIRVSAVGGRAGPGYHTLEIQRASIERTAAFRQHELIDVLTDEDQSGKSRNRPQFQAAMTRVLSGEADAIVVWKVSRFSRSWQQAAEDVQTLLDAGKDLLSEEGFDTATAGGRMTMRILFSLANWELEVLGEQWEVIKAKAVRDRGSFLAPAPFGYLHGQSGGVLARDPVLAPVVVAMFERRAAGGSWAELIDLYDEALPRPRGRRIRRDAERVIMNRVYLGETRWRDEVREDAHEPLVSEALWKRANLMVTFESGRRRKQPQTRSFPLSGWLHCCGCERGMGGSVFRGRNRKEIACYTCNGRRGGCPNPQTITAKPVEAWVLDQAAGMYERWRLVADDRDDGELGVVLARLAETELALHELASLEMRRQLGEDWLPMMQRLRAEKATFEDDAAGLRRRHGLLAGMQTAWVDLDVEERWTALRSMAPLGVLVSPVVGWRDPVGRLGFIVEDGAEGDAVLDSEESE